jgi:hypothetical protein
VVDGEVAYFLGVEKKGRCILMRQVPSLE